MTTTSTPGQLIVDWLADDASSDGENRTSDPDAPERHLEGRVQPFDSLIGGGPVQSPSLDALRKDLLRAVARVERLAEEAAVAPVEAAPNAVIPWSDEGSARVANEELERFFQAAMRALDENARRPSSTAAGQTFVLRTVGRRFGVVSAESMVVTRLPRAAREERQDGTPQ